MKTEYEYRHIDRLAKSLEKHGVAPEIIAQIMEGGEEIRRSASGEKKAAWLKGAMLRMGRLLDNLRSFSPWKTPEASVTTAI